MLIFVYYFFLNLWTLLVVGLPVAWRSPIWHCRGHDSKQSIRVMWTVPSLCHSQSRQQVVKWSTIVYGKRRDPWPAVEPKLYLWWTV